MKQLHKYLSITLLYPYLIILFISRCIICIYSSYYGEVNFHFKEVIEIFSKGSSFDFLGYIYLLLPILTINIFFPIKWRFNKLYRYCSLAIFYLFILSLIIIAFLEVLFWDAFSIKFNSETINYLFDAKKVTNSVIEISKVAIYIILILVAFIIFFIFSKNFTLSMNDYLSSRNKRYQFFIVLSLGLLIELYFHPNMIKSNNNYVNELSNNSIYNYTKPRLNSFDYYQHFYKNINLEAAFTNVKEHLLQVNQQYINFDEYNITRDVKQNGKKKKLNIILINVANLNNEFIGKKINGRNLTPYVSNLKKKSITFSNFYANDIDSNRNLKSIMLGLPSLPDNDIFVGFSKEDFSLAKILKENNYLLRFTHAVNRVHPNYYMKDYFAQQGFINEELYHKSLGLERGFVNEAGLTNEAIFNQVLLALDKVNKEGKLFYQHIQTVSSKQPYTYQDNKIDINYSSDEVYGTIKYIDSALKIFIEKAKTKKWFKDTIFIITADQCNNNYEEKISLEQYHIPLIIYSPYNFSPKIINKLSSHMDLAPTILGLLNINYQSKFFGNDIFLKEKEFVFIKRSKYLGYYQDNNLIILSPQKKIRQSKKNIKLDAYYNPLENMAISFYQVASKYNSWRFLSE